MANTIKTRETAQEKSFELLYALNAVATRLQNSIRNEENVYTVFRTQTIALGLRGGISLLDDTGANLIFKTVAFTNPLKKLLNRYEDRLKTSAEGYTVPVERVDVYQQVIRDGRSVFVQDTSTISIQVVPKQIKNIIGPLLSILGHPPGIFTPLVYEGTVRGMLNLVGPHLTEGDVPTMQAFANQIAVTLENTRLVQKLEAANKQLQQEIATLERFTYAISHELKNPIITMKGYLGSIERDLLYGNYERAQKDILRVTAASDRLHETLSDLLELSRIGHIVNLPEEIELGTLVKEAMEALGERLQSREITVLVAPELPVVCGDRNRLREVYVNLLENALKNFGDQPSPRIEIGVRGIDTDVTLFVKDNGVGIEPKYHTKIFGLFEKLDARSEGTGVGLALVKRIIEVHGGRIWVESEGQGKGSTFCFTLPEQRKQGKSQTWSASEGSGSI